MTNGAGWRSRLLNDHWFGELPAGLQDSLLDALRQRRVTPGKPVFERGEPPCGLYALVEGSVRVAESYEHHGTVVHGSPRLPYWFGEVSLFDGLPRTVDMFSFEQSIVLHVPHEVLTRLLEQHPAYWRSFRALISQKLGIPVLSAEQQTLLPVTTSVAWRLLLLVCGYGELDYAARLIRLSDLNAKVMSLAPEVLLPVLELLQKNKVLRIDGEWLQILDLDKLRKAANAAPIKSLS